MSSILTILTPLAKGVGPFRPPCPDPLPAGISARLKQYLTVNDACVDWVSVNEILNEKHHYHGLYQVMHELQSAVPVQTVVVTAIRQLVGSSYVATRAAFSATFWPTRGSTTPRMSRNGIDRGI